jgi:hypothetical protein
MDNLNVSYADFVFNEGRIASIEGLENNPYQPEKTEHEYWWSGWYYQEAQNMNIEENRKRIAVYLEVHGPTSAADLERALQLTKGKVWQALKDKRFKQGDAAKWMMSDAEEVKPVNVIQHLCIIEQIDKEIQDCQKNIRNLENQIETYKQLKAQQDRRIETLRVVKGYHEGQFKTDKDKEKITKILSGQFNEHAKTHAEKATATPRR